MPTEAEIRGPRLARIAIAGQATAGTADEFPVLRAPRRMKVTGARFIPKAAITADATNYLTLTLRNRGAAGAGTTQVAARSFATGNAAAFVADAMTVSATAANLILAAGDVLTAEKLNSGTGLALPAGTLEVAYLEV
jgi:hypothetical protein